MLLLAKHGNNSRASNVEGEDEEMVKTLVVKIIEMNTMGNRFADGKEYRI